MENENKINIEEKDQWNRWEHHDSTAGKIFGGSVLLTAGALLMARQMGYEIASWIFTWPVLLIVIGLYIGIKHSFRHIGWIFPVLVGGFFLADRLILDFSMSQYIWPVALMALGLLVILKPKRKFRKKRHEKCQRKWEQYQAYQAIYHAQNSPEDYLDSVSVFSGIKKNIITKDFKGGDVVNVFGGAEINLSQADINGKVVLEISQVFGGTSLIVPAHWELQSELGVVFMGAVEDKRQATTNLAVDSTKILVLRGVTVFGGIEIKSF